MPTGSYSSRRFIFLIVISQFACTSLWFAGNAVAGDIIREYGAQEKIISWLTIAVQLGFITGTLIFSILTLSDRFSPSKVFFACALTGATVNLATCTATTITGVIASRYITGMCLAGIYPVGMKLAADYNKQGLGKALGFLVGALVLGTAFPHLLKAVGASLQWRYVLYGTSAMAVAGGTVIFLLVPDGPFRAKAGKPDFSLFLKLFRNKNFRSAATGYFGHMWELYAFWAFIPVILATYNKLHVDDTFDVPLYSFLVIGSGGLSCMAGGLLSMKYGNAKVAAIALSVSGLCCLASPLIFNVHPILFASILLIWGLAVVADSPQFTTLVAMSVPPHEKGTALTIVNAIGFFITIISIQVVNVMMVYIDPRYLYLILAIGPCAGLFGISRLLNKPSGR